MGFGRVCYGTFCGSTRRYQDIIQVDFSPQNHTVNHWCANFMRKGNPKPETLESLNPKTLKPFNRKRATTPNHDTSGCNNAVKNMHDKQERSLKVGTTNPVGFRV